MAKILVAGLGQSGATAAYRLALSGHDVTVFEAQSRTDVGYPWRDDVRFDGFERSGVHAPEQEGTLVQKGSWRFVSPDGKNGLNIPPLAPMEEVSVARRALSAHFAKIIDRAGGKVIFDAKVDRLIVENDRVTGLVVSGEEHRGDLVVDATGMYSKLREEVPDKFLVEKRPEDEDRLDVYRAFFKRREEAETPVPACTLHLKHLGGAGVSWCNLSQDGTVDVLIGRVGSLSDEELERSLADLKKNHPILTDELVLGRRVKVCVRYPLSVPVADGYIALGDSAYMTMPMMGSGIEAGMKAAKLFADFATENKITDFTAKNMWPFWVKFEKGDGKVFALVDVVKRWALFVNPKDADWLFSCGAITGDDLDLIASTDNSGKKIPVFKMIGKVFVLLKRPGLVARALGAVLRGVKAMTIAGKVPKKYDLKKIDKWQRKLKRAVRKADGK